VVRAFLDAFGVKARKGKKLVRAARMS